MMPTWPLAAFVIKGWVLIKLTTRLHLSLSTLSTQSNQLQLDLSTLLSSFLSDLLSCWDRRSFMKEDVFAQRAQCFAAISFLWSIDWAIFPLSLQTDIFGRLYCPFFLILKVNKHFTNKWQKIFSHNGLIQGDNWFGGGVYWAQPFY